MTSLLVLCTSCHVWFRGLSSAIPNLPLLHMNLNHCIGGGKKKLRRKIKNLQSRKKTDPKADLRSKSLQTHQNFQLLPSLLAAIRNFPLNTLWIPKPQKHNLILKTQESQPHCLISFGNTGEIWLRIVIITTLPYVYTVIYGFKHSLKTISGLKLLLEILKLHFSD